jgi:CHAT domain-containing protein
VASAWNAARGVGPAHAPSAEEQAVQLEGAGASEAAVKRLAPGRRVLHLATHGFFVDPSCGESAGGGRGIGGLAPADTTARTADEPSRSGDSPLRLSGLALAGANRRADAPADAEDGVLTAEEMAALDLTGVEWAVLSACDTGVGEIGSREGVFGLRRALQIAGVHTVVSSLWAVEDESARRWMDALYHRRLVRGEDTVASVNGAMRDELARRRAAGLSTHPFHWAGFVASGDWR